MGKNTTGNLLLCHGGYMVNKCESLCLYQQEDIGELKTISFFGKRFQ